MNWCWNRSLQITIDNMKSSLFNRGYTLLFAMIVASVVLSIAAFILSTSRKQFILTSAAEDSTIAVYAADSAIQCAVEAYFEDHLATSSPKNEVYCNGMTYTFIFSGALGTDSPLIDSGMNLLNNGPSGKYQVNQTNTPLKFELSNNSCALVTITVGYDKNTTPPKHKIIVDSRGYNDKDSWPCNQEENAPVNPRAVERAIRLIYLD